MQPILAVNILCSCALIQMYGGGGGDLIKYFLQTKLLGLLQDWKKCANVIQCFQLRDIIILVWAGWKELCHQT